MNPCCVLCAGQAPCAATAWMSQRRLASPRDTWHGQVCQGRSRSTKMSNSRTELGSCSLERSFSHPKLFGFWTLSSLKECRNYLNMNSHKRQIHDHNLPKPCASPSSALSDSDSQCTAHVMLALCPLNISSPQHIQESLAGKGFSETHEVQQEVRSWRGGCPEKKTLHVIYIA